MPNINLGWYNVTFNIFSFYLEKYMHNIKVNYSNIITFQNTRKKKFSIQVEASYSINNVL